MKRLRLLILAVFLSAAGIATSTAMPLADPVISLGKVRIGTTSAREIMKEYGNTQLVRVGREDGSPLSLCYYATSPVGKSYIIFEFGPMGGFDRLTGFRLASKKYGKRCIQATTSIFGITGNGVQLNLRRSEFLKRFDVTFRNKGGSLVFYEESERKASAEELKNLRKAWPAETQEYFDVTSTINAHFQKGRLTDYYVSVIESY